MSRESKPPTPKPTSPPATQPQVHRDTAKPTNNGSADFETVGADVLLRAKQRLYFVTLVIIALAASMAFLVETVSADHSDPVQQAVNIPAIALCVGLCITLTRLHMVPTVERVLAICTTTYVLVVDVSNIATRNDALDILLGYDPMVIMACVVIALAAPPRWSQYLTWIFFMLHTALSWVATVQVGQGISLIWRLQSDCVVAVTIAFISLLTTYSRVLGINRSHSQSLQQLALTDQLTQLPNRRALTEALETNPFASVVLLDIDNFKKLNDKHGHAKGDEALQRTAVVLHEVFGDHGTVGRWGGEEFLAVIPQGTVRQGHALAEEARLRIMALDSGPKVTISSGVTAHNPGEDVKAAIDRADVLLYQAKSEGKNRVAADLKRGSLGSRRPILTQPRAPWFDVPASPDSQPPANDDKTGQGNAATPSANTGTSPDKVPTSRANHTPAKPTSTKVSVVARRTTRTAKTASWAPESYSEDSIADQPEVVDLTAGTIAAPASNLADDLFGQRQQAGDTFEPGRSPASEPPKKSATDGERSQPGTYFSL